MSSACGLAVLVGGLGMKDGVGIPLADAWLWDGATWRSSDAPPERAYAAAASSGATMELFGGQDNGEPQSSLFLWNGTTWTGEKRQEIWPQARYGAILAQVPAGLLLFGGGDLSGHDAFRDTWLWTGKTWILKGDPHFSPASSASASAATVLGTVVLFGGQDANGDLSQDTWIWDGSVWSLAPQAQDPHSQPAKRRFATMATLGETVILFGGMDSRQEALGDTWIWNGTWAPGPQTGPSPRYAASMTAF